MKRLWIAFIFLVIAAVLCVFEQYHLNRFYQEMDAILVTAIAAEAEQNRPVLETSIRELQQYWETHNDLIFTMTNHGVLDELSKSIHALNNSEYRQGLYKIRAVLKVFYENQRITVTNIF